MFASLVLVVVLAAEPADPRAFPVPAEKGMKLDLTATEFRVPFGLTRVERFYRDYFKDRTDIAFLKSEEESQTVLTVKSLRKGDRWTKAVVRSDGTTCRIAVSRVIVLDEGKVKGELPPVQFVFARSGLVKEQLDSIDHLQR